MLEMIGLNDYIKRMQVDFITNRMICGYIGKRSKGKVKFFQKRWFLIISAKPLVITLKLIKLECKRI
jgi:hypothetical protein